MGVFSRQQRADDKQQEGTSAQHAGQLPGKPGTQRGDQMNIAQAKPFFTPQALGSVVKGIEEYKHADTACERSRWGERAPRQKGKQQTCQPESGGITQR